MGSIANPWHHSVSSTRRWGGAPEDYLAIHEWFDETKAWCPDFRHRAIRHHSEGVFECMQKFGATIALSTCRVCGEPQSSHPRDLVTGMWPLRHEYFSVRLVLRSTVRAWRKFTKGGKLDHKFEAKLIPVRWIGEQHVQEDLGFIPTAADWLRRISGEPWMNRSRRLSRELEREGAA